MILVVYGTTGELIKLAPVLTRLQARDARFINATTAQQVEQIPALLDQLELPAPDVWLGNGARGRDLQTNTDIPLWLATVATRFARRAPGLRRRMRSDALAPLVLVHGDTMTTVIGTLMGRALRAPVAHVEAGVRTHDIFHPFPEELNRRAVSRLAQIHYAPGPAATRNLNRGIVVDTGLNTIRDSIDLVPPEAELLSHAREGRYAIVSLHRYELLKDERLLRSTLEILARHAGDTRMLFIDHPVTMAAIRRFGLESFFDEAGLVRVQRLDFFGFVSLLRNSAFVVTDSGGSQLEAYALDIPCLIHRKRVEQPDGVGENVVVSGFRADELERFLGPVDPSPHNTSCRCQPLRDHRLRSRPARIRGLSDKLRVAVVGAGQMGRHHARVIAESTFGELVAVVDPRPEAEEVAQLRNALWLPSTEALLQQVKPDFAVVAVPTAQHVELAGPLLDAGIPVLVEKPLAATVAEARQLIDIAESRGVLLAVGHVERFNPAVRVLRDKLRAQELGRVFQVHARRLSPFPVRVGDTGVALDLATHELDIMCELAGSPTRISAEHDRRAHRTHEDLLAATLRFDSGIIGLLEVNWLTPTKVRQLTVTGERGMYVIDYLNQHLTLYENAHESESWSTLDIFDGVTEGNVIRYAIPRVEPLQAELEAFAQAVRGEDVEIVSAEDGLRALELAILVVEAGSSGKTLQLEAFKRP